jgi:hypothetical protein
MIVARDGRIGARPKSEISVRRSASPLRQQRTSDITATGCSRQAGAARRGNPILIVASSAARASAADQPPHGACAETRYVCLSAPSAAQSATILIHLSYEWPCGSNAVIKVGRDGKAAVGRGSAGLDWVAAVKPRPKVIRVGWSLRRVGRTFTDLERGPICPKHTSGLARILTTDPHQEGRPRRGRKSEYYAIRVPGITNQHRSGDDRYLHTARGAGRGALAPRDARFFQVGHSLPSPRGSGTSADMSREYVQRVQPACGRAGTATSA